MKPEADLQCRIVHYLRSNNILCFAPCNEAFMTLLNTRKPDPETTFKKRSDVGYGLFQHYINMGFEKGVLDVWILHKGGVFVIECKSPTGKLSPSQIGFIARLERESIPYLVTDCYYTALDQLDKWGVVKN